jgi:hypothetical protein
MTTFLSKPVVRGLTKFPGVIVTLTEDGITLRVKRHQKSVTVPWVKILGAAAMKSDNEKIILKHGEDLLKDLGFDALAQEGDLKDGLQ